MKRILLTAFLLFAAASAAAAPSSLELRYSMYFGGIYIAEKIDRLVFSEDGYLIDSVAEPEGLAKILNQPTVIRRSEGGYQDDGQLQFNSYDERRGERTRKIHLDPQAGVVEWEDSKHGPGTAPYEGQLVADPLTLVYSPYAAGKIDDLATWYADGRKFIEYETVTADEQSSFNVGDRSLEARKIELVSDDKNRSREVWFAEELGYLPVKMKIVNGGSVIEFMLLSVREISGADGKDDHKDGGSG